MVDLLTLPTSTPLAITSLVGAGRYNVIASRYNVIETIVGFLKCQLLCIFQMDVLIHIAILFKFNIIFVTSVTVESEDKGR